MLTLSNILPCQLHPGSNAAISNRHDSQMRLDFPGLCGSQVSMTGGRCPVGGFFGHFNQAFPNYERACALPPGTFPGNAGASPVCCNPCAPQSQVIHLFPTFVNVVQEKPPHIQPQICQLKPRSQVPPNAELCRQGRLPPISMFSSALHRQNLCGDNKRDSFLENGCGLRGINDLNSFRTYSESSLAHESNNLNQYQFSVEVVNTKKRHQVFKTTKVSQGHRTVKKTVTSSVRYCKRLKELLHTDISHSIASILDDSTRGMLGAGSGSVQKSSPFNEHPRRAGFEVDGRGEGVLGDYSGGSDASAGESDDDKSDVDVTSCSGDENDDECDHSMVGTQCYPSHKEEDDKNVEMDKQTEMRISSPIHHQASSEYTQSANSHTDGKTYNELKHPATIEDHCLGSFTLNSENGKEFHPTELSGVHGSSNTPLHPIKTLLPPIESLYQTDVRKTASDGRSAFTPINKTSGFTNTLWSPKQRTRIRDTEVTYPFKINACGDKSGSDKLRLIQQLHDTNKALIQQATENRNTHNKGRHQIPESVETDAVRLFRHQNFLYPNAHNEALVEGALPDTAGAWFQWLQQRETQTIGSRTEKANVARCPPQPPPRYHCDACNKTYSTFGGLSKHRQFHCSEHVRKEFACNVCSKSYSSLGALKMHIRTHTLPCKCHVCGKAFSRPWLLQGHVRTHTGEKPFRCSHCGRAFADRSNLRAHLQTHADIKKYACRKCGKTFSRMSLLTKHAEGSCPVNTKSLVQ